MVFFLSFESNAIVFSVVGIKIQWFCFFVISTKHHCLPRFFLSRTKNTFVFLVARKYHCFSMSRKNTIDFSTFRTSSSSHFKSYYSSELSESLSVSISLSLARASSINDDNSRPLTSDSSYLKVK